MKTEVLIFEIVMCIICLFILWGCGQNGVTVDPPQQTVDQNHVPVPVQLPMLEQLCKNHCEPRSYKFSEHVEGFCCRCEI